MRVLYVAPYLAFPPIGGPELRTWNSLRALALAKDVALLVMAPKDANSSTRAAISELGAKLVDAPRTTLRAKVFGQRTSLVESLVRSVEKEKVDAIWWSFASLYAHAIEEICLRLPRVLIVADTDSVWSRFVGRGVVAATSDEHRDEILGEARRAEFAEASLMQHAHVVTAVSEVDASHYRRLPGSAQVRLFANVIHLADFGDEFPSLDRRASAISVSGSFYAEHSPMVHGTRWLLRDVMPIVWSLNPEVGLRVVGRGSSKFFSADDSRVKILGQVVDIHREIAGTRAALVPLFFESGTRFKILEAAALGTPVVSTSLGAEGLSLNDLSEICVADSASEFASRVISVFNNCEQSLLMAQNALRVVRAEYSLEVAAGQAEDVLSALL